MCACSAASLGFLSGCGSNTNATGSNTNTPPITDVYVAGYESSAAGPDTAVYWKDGVPTTLPDQNLGSQAFSIAVSGSNVYLAGRVNNGTVDVATYWNNGTAVALTDGTREAVATSIFASGTDIYVAGYEFSGTSGDPSNPGYGVAMYWKNGIPVALTDGTEPAEASSIFVSGTDVYVAGFEETDTQTGPTTYAVNPVATYWKNGAPVALTNGEQASEASSIFVSGSDVYVAGYYCTVSAPDCSRPLYWKNGMIVPLTFSSSPAIVSSIFVSGSNVYTVGGEGAVGTGASLIADYWENGAETQLAESGNGVAANQIVVSNGDTYIAGAEGEGGFPQQAMALYWKNGIAVPLTSGTNVVAVGFAIAVSTH